ncbi:MAG TPA: DUF1552 domain-containing protein [Blastocatellia bacterium]|nr:DUF1552 domain-containing protein [Blastocatellia bacterium]
MIIEKKSLPRRTFLRGMGVTLALPMLDAMTPALAPTAKPVVRLGFVYVPNGIIMNKWTPVGEGANFEFKSTMKPLEAYRERLLVLSGLAQVQGRALGDGAGDHARAGATWLTGVHPKKSEITLRAGISADQIAAQQLSKYTQFGSLELGIESNQLAGNCDSGYSCAYTNTMAWRNETTPLPVENNPRAIFERLFGDGDSTDAAERLAQFKRQRSLLDYVNGNLKRLNASLGAADRAKMNEYSDAIRDIERRIQKAEQQNATIKMPVMERPTAVPEEFEDHVKMVMDLQVLAYQTDLTRVITLMMAREGSNRPYRNINISDGHHNLTHHQNDEDKIAKVTKINEVHVKLFAYLLERLKATPDVDGNLLDNSLVMYGSSISDGNLHTHHDLPIVVAGGGGGAVKGNRHVMYPKETPLNNLLLAMLETAGVQTEKFGDSTGKLDLEKPVQLSKN